MDPNELASRCKAFWDALARGDRDGADTYLRSLRPPSVEYETYSYESSPMEETTGGGAIQVGRNGARRTSDLRHGS